MTTTTTGLALKSFYADSRLWSNQDGKTLYWVDDLILSINGAEVIEDSVIPALHDQDEVQILCGAVYCFEDLHRVSTLAEYFKRWQGRRPDGAR